MKELKDILKAFNEADKLGKQTALATVVHLEGSAYRRPGARMLVTEEGKLTGAISGGCLEGDALRKAQLVMVQKKPMLVTYDTTDEDDAKLGVGLGCNGIISILIEPIFSDDTNNPIELIRTFLSKRQTGVLITLFSLDKNLTQPGTCMLVAASGEIKNSLSEGSLLQYLIDDAQQVLLTGTTLTKMYTVENTLTGFIEILKPAVSLVIFGAGNDSIPLVQIAHTLGWETTVVDGRPNYATIERFQLADQVIVSKPADVLSKLFFDEFSVAALMTHNFNYDLAVLRELLPLRLPYIGALGPKKKMNRMLEDLREEGLQLDEKTISNIYGPVGLDIGAETPEEIALSIISEIKTVLSKKTAISLRQKEEIHPRDEQQIAFKVLPAS